MGVPCPTPNSSPQTPSSSPSQDPSVISNKRLGLIGLVDYPDEDSDEEEEEEIPNAKRPRLST